MTKPYVEGTTLEQILADGWSRGFAPYQTVAEATEMGFEVTVPQVLVAWAKKEAEFDQWVRDMDA